MGYGTRTPTSNDPPRKVVAPRPTVKEERFLSDVTDLMQQQAARHFAFIEGVLAQLVGAGVGLEELYLVTSPLGDGALYRRMSAAPDVSMLSISTAYSHKELTVVTTYKLYPDGRPGGWPVLALGDAG